MSMKRPQNKKGILQLTVAAFCLGTLLGGCGKVEKNQTAVTADTETLEETTVGGETENLQEKQQVEGLNPSDYDFRVDYSDIKTGNVSSGVVVHDPSVFKVGDTYYLYGSHMASARGKDLTNWETMSTGYVKSNPVYGQIYDVAEQSFAYAGSKNSLIPTEDGKEHVWAPHVIYNENLQKYCMYYCTSSTWNVSNLCLATADSPEGPFIWQTALLYSGFSSETIKQTNVSEYMDLNTAKWNYLVTGQFDSKNWPNCIDPTVFSDTDGRMWMVYGSWSGGIFLLEIDPQTGLIVHPKEDKAAGIDTYYGKYLLGGGNQSLEQSIEGAYVLYDPQQAHYYLYVSYGSLVNEGGYQIRVFRSENPDGPYVDMEGCYPTKQTFNYLHGLKLSGNYRLPSLEKAYMATGHNSAFIDDDGKQYVVYHTRFEGMGEKHSPRVHQLIMNEQGWPCMLPYQTNGETIQTDGYDVNQVVGRYFVITQGMDLSAQIAESVILYLLEDGRVLAGQNLDGFLMDRETGEAPVPASDSTQMTVIGAWKQMEGSYYVQIGIDEVEYNGVFCEMMDEAGTKVMTFSCVGQNHSLWGVKYE